MVVLHRDHGADGYFEADHRPADAGGDAVHHFRRFSDQFHADLPRLRFRLMGVGVGADILPSDVADELRHAGRPAGRGAALHLHGHHDGTGRADGAAVPRGAADDESHARRALHSGLVCLDDLCGGDRHRRRLRHDPWDHGGADDDQVRLQHEAIGRRDHGWRHARHSHPALDHADRHGAGAGSAGDGPVPRRDHSGDHAGGALPALFPWPLLAGFVAGPDPAGG